MSSSRPLIDTLAPTESALTGAQHQIAGDLVAALPRTIRATAAQATGPTAEVIAAMAALAGRRNALMQSAGRMIDPETAPHDVLPWLSAWFGWGWLFQDPADPRRTLDMATAFPPGPERLRALIKAWPALQSLRGRAEGLRQTLIAATGLTGIIVQTDPARQHLTIHTPQLPPGWTAWFRRLIAAERPAHLTWSHQQREAAA